MTDEEAKSVASRLNASSASVVSASVNELAQALGVEESKVARELEILRHEQRIAELERERQEEEARLRAMRAEQDSVVEDPEAKREAFLRRQEQMYAWQHKGEVEEEEKPVLKKPRLNPIAMMVIGAILLFALFQILSFSCARGVP